MKLIHYSTLVFLLLSLSANQARATTETYTLTIPKQQIVNAFNTVLQSTEVHISNYGPKQGASSWLSQQSVIHPPYGNAVNFNIPEYETKLSKVRKWKHYVNDMNSQNIEVVAHGNGLKLTLDFESQGEEIKGKCLRWKVIGKYWTECSLKMERDIHVDNARVVLLLTPVAYQGGIVYKPLGAGDVTFSANLNIPNALCNAFPLICSAVENKIYSGLREAIQNRLRDILNSTQLRNTLAAKVKTALSQKIKTDWTVNKVESSGSNYKITVQRPVVVDANSVSISQFKVKKNKATMTCPGKVDFSATINTKKHGIKGKVWLEYLAPKAGSSNKQNWNMPKSGSATSTLTQKWQGKLMGMAWQTGKTRLVVSWKGSNGKTYTKKSQVVSFQRKCTAPISTVPPKGIKPLQPGILQPFPANPPREPAKPSRFGPTGSPREPAKPSRFGPTGSPREPARPSRFGPTGSPDEPTRPSRFGPTGSPCEPALPSTFGSTESPCEPAKPSRFRPPRSLAE